MREELSRCRRNAWLLATIGTIACIGSVVGAVVVGDREEELERTGRRVRGVVVATGSLPVVSDHIDVEFVDGDVVRTTRVHLDDDSPAYRVGQGVTVLVDPADPGHVSIDGEANQAPWTVWPMIISLVGGGVAMGTGWISLGRARRQRRLMSRAAWRRVAVRCAEIPRSRAPVRTVLLLSEDGDEHLMALVDSQRSKRVGSRLLASVEAEVVGPLPGVVVVRAPGSEVVTTARPPFTRWHRRTWAKAF